MPSTEFAQIPQKPEDLAWIRRSRVRLARSERLGLIQKIGTKTRRCRGAFTFIAISKTPRDEPVASVEIGLNLHWAGNVARIESNSMSSGLR